MDLRDRPEDEAFRTEVRAWLAEHVVGEYAALGGRGGSGDETFGFETRRAWEKELAAGGWIGLGWPTACGGRGATIAQQVIFNEEYVTAGAPGRVGVLGEGLLGPTLVQYGTPEQQARFLPPILAGTELWCQGYSEPDAGSDLANVQTKAELVGDEWVVTGQKVWTSLAHQADWCFVVCRTEPGSSRHRGLSYLLVPMDQPGVEVRPITQLTRTSEFNEVFFDGARTRRDHVVGQPGDGWRVALATLTYERGWDSSATRSPSGASSSTWSGRPGSGADHRPGRAPAPGPGLRRARGAALRHPPQPDQFRRAGGVTRGVDHQTLLVRVAPAPRGAGRGRARSGRTGGRRPALRARRVPAHLPLQPRRDHLRRLRPDPAQHHRRTGAGSGTRAQGGQR